MPNTHAPSRGLGGKLLRQAPKLVASLYYQLLSGHAAIGPYLKAKIRKTDDDRVVRGRKETDPSSPFYGVQGLAPPEFKAVEGNKEGS